MFKSAYMNAMLDEAVALYWANRRYVIAQQRQEESK